MIRRVVTGHKEGKAVVLSDGVPPRTHIFEAMRGMASSFAWAEPARPRILTNGVADTVDTDTPMIPKAGETRLVLLQIPPDSWALRDDFDAAAAGEEFVRLHPEMAAAQEPDSPGMHRTDSIDYIIVLDGEIHLEVDDQQEVLLKEHDVVVQLGARHAWRNKADKPALLAVVLVGAEREA